MQPDSYYVPQAQVGRAAPSFDLPSTKNLQTLAENVNLGDYAGRWLVLVFYPLDFTFVCPTELRGFSDRYEDFRKEGADVLGISVDSVFTHRAWINASRDAGGLGEIRYPLASDITHRVSQEYGVFLEEKGHSLRGTFIIDPVGVLRMSLVNDLDVGRSVEETLRTVQLSRREHFARWGGSPDKPR